jgi:lipoyl(octanoyl) transferase
MISLHETPDILCVEDFKLCDYAFGLALQQKAVQEAIADGQQKLLLGEHPVVLTLGRTSSWDHILKDPQELSDQGIKVVTIDRGGEVTLHNPGQLVVYPIINLNWHGKDLRAYLHNLEQVAIDFFKEFDIMTSRLPGRTGVWVGNRKIVSIGIGVRRWITYHGMAINVNNSLEHFSLIKPCGLDVTMTSLSELIGKKVDMELAKQVVVKQFCRIFDMQANWEAKDSAEFLTSNK